MATAMKLETTHGEPKVLIKYEEMVIMPNMLDSLEKSLKFIKEMPYTQGDILLCSYPKSGTNWMKGLIEKLVNPIHDIGTLLELATQEQIQAVDGPRLFFTHLRPKRLPEDFINKGGKIILVLRNPKDVVVSGYHHLKNAGMFANKQTWDEYFKSVMDGIIPYGVQFDYLDDWGQVLKQKEAGQDNFDVEVFTFEDLKANGLETLRRLDRHLGGNKSDEELKRVLEGCSINKLREEANSAKEKIPQGMRDKDGNSVIFRKGEVGDWKNYFTVQQNEVFDQIIETRLKDSIFRFVYEL